MEKNKHSYIFFPKKITEHFVYLKLYTGCYFTDYMNAFLLLMIFSHDFKCAIPPTLKFCLEIQTIKHVSTFTFLCKGN